MIQEDRGQNARRCAGQEALKRVKGRPESRPHKRPIVGAVRPQVLLSLVIKVTLRDNRGPVVVSARGRRCGHRGFRAGLQVSSVRLDNSSPCRGAGGGALRRASDKSLTPADARLSKEERQRSVSPGVRPFGGPVHQIASDCFIVHIFIGGPPRGHMTDGGARARLRLDNSGLRDDCPAVASVSV